MNILCLPVLALQSVLLGPAVLMSESQATLNPHPNLDPLNKVQIVHFIKSSWGGSWSSNPLGPGA